MEYKETESKTMETQSMIEDVNYFKYIFKKTEKIACAVFYILRSQEDMSHIDSVVIDLEDTAHRVLDTALESLTCTETHLKDMVCELRFALVALESKLRLAHVARYIGGKHLAVFLHEIDSVYRAMKKYTEENVQNPFDEALASTQNEQLIRKKVERKERSGLSLEKKTSTEGVYTHTVHISRRDRIKDFLRDSPQATIKDISQVITDCSEKTIQRELIDMIKDNIVVREGERRWSRYELA